MTPVADFLSPDMAVDWLKEVLERWFAIKLINKGEIKWYIKVVRADMQNI